MPARVIAFLKSTDGYVSGEDMSRQLNMSRAAIWKHIKQLRTQGYDIVAVPHLGYKLNSIPDKLFPQEIKAGLNADDFGVHIFYHEQIDSTMNHAFDLGLQGAEEGTLVVAEAQTQGRGRQGRVWTSPKGKGVYLSLIVRPSLSVMEVPKLTLMTAVAVCEAVEELTGMAPQIKWPNDIFVDGKKLSGILTEMRAEMDRVHFVVIGLGLNVNNTKTQLIDEATSLKFMTGKAFSRVEVVQCVLEKMETRYREFLEQGFDALVGAWKQRSLTLNQRVELRDGEEVLRGEAVDLAEDGGLLIRRDDGVVVKKMAGDVFTAVSRQL